MVIICSTIVLERRQESSNEILRRSHVWPDGERVGLVTRAAPGAIDRRGRGSQASAVPHRPGPRPHAVFRRFLWNREDKNPRMKSSGDRMYGLMENGSA